MQRFSFEKYSSAIFWSNQCREWSPANLGDLWRKNTLWYLIHRVYSWVCISRLEDFSGILLKFWTFFYLMSNNFNEDISWFVSLMVFIRIYMINPLIFIINYTIYPQVNPLNALNEWNKSSIRKYLNQIKNYVDPKCIRLLHKVHNF